MSAAAGPQVHGRRAIGSHPLSHRISLIEGDSVADDTFAKVASHIPPGRPGARCTRLAAHARTSQPSSSYAPLVTPDSYLVVFDGMMAMVADPNAGVDWATDNPLSAVDEFLDGNETFERDPLYGRIGVTYCPGGILRRRCRGIEHVTDSPRVAIVVPTPESVAPGGNGGQGRPGSE